MGQDPRVKSHRSLGGKAKNIAHRASGSPVGWVGGGESRRRWVWKRQTGEGDGSFKEGLAGGPRGREVVGQRAESGYFVKCLGRIRLKRGFLWASACSCSTDRQEDL